jgi:hypothetical protein
MTYHDQGAFDAATITELPRSFAPLDTTRERDWLVPSAIMTSLLGLAALMLMPVAGYTEIPPYFSRFVGWLNYMAAGGIFLLLVQMVRLRKAGEERPIAALKAKFLANRATTFAAVAGAMLAGIDMLFFMWIKPEVTAVAPFWADDLFADIDQAIFGTDPWRLFQGMDLTFHAWAYSFFWAVAIMATLVWLLARRPSRERSTALLSYFALWSLFGPIGQLLGSAAGPIFYSRVGLGDRFAGLEANIPEVTQQISGYLWNFHITGELGVGAGISAMPSLHIATVTWITLSFLGLKSRLAPLTALFALYIFALSVALGWHYAIDGIAGAAGAIISHSACRAWLRRRESAAAPAGAAVLA